MAATALVSLSSASHCFDVQFHPAEPLVAIATISGEIELHRYDLEATSSEKRLSWAAHADSCRTARFLPSSGC
ncbi:unnamed protein product [Prorocentrum cordatum]|uniref:Uncharacterized protein n=1 Tax=Prorocentrum cordatum TaxID=2364126 RepID=A0ABN9QMS0_9DINO|nr:unnamed protein product [Polarella glacialis]